MARILNSAYIRKHVIDSYYISLSISVAKYFIILQYFLFFRRLLKINNVDMTCENQDSWVFRPIFSIVFGWIIFICEFKILLHKIYTLNVKRYSMQPGERHIFERGCLRAGEEWIESNLVPVAAVKVGIMVLQVIIYRKFSKFWCCFSIL